MTDQEIDELRRLERLRDAPHEQGCPGDESPPGCLCGLAFDRRTAERKLRNALPRLLARLADAGKAYEQSAEGLIAGLRTENEALLARLDAAEELLMRLHVDDWYVYEGRIEASARLSVELVDAIRAHLGARAGRRRTMVNWIDDVHWKPGVFAGCDRCRSLRAVAVVIRWPLSWKTPALLLTGAAVGGLIVWMVICGGQP